MRNQVGCNRPRSWPWPPLPFTAGRSCQHLLMVSSDQLISFDCLFELSKLKNTKGLTKIKQYNWNSIGPVGKFEWINKKEIYIDRNYQRNENQQKSNEIAATWSWQACNAISVMRRPDGSFFAVDGQHRLLASWKRADIVDVPCMVFESQGDASEAMAFIELNSKRKPVGSYAKYRAKLVAGDNSAKEITRITSEHGLSIRADGDAPGTIICVAALQKLYAKHSDCFEIVIAAAAKAARQDGVQVSSILILGLDYLHSRLPLGLSDKKVIARIVHVGAKALQQGAQKMSYRAGAGGEKIWAEGMLETLNYGTRNKFKLGS